MSDKKEEKVFTKIVAVSAVTIAIVALYFIIIYGTSNKLPSKYEETSTGKADIGGAFTLVDTDGNDFSSDKLLGKYSIIYFGFTFCPDICPTALEKLSIVIDDLAKNNIDVTPIFITIDPLRDKPENLKPYLARFHQKFIGLSANNEEDTRKVADKFKVFYEKIPESGTGRNDHLFDHSSFIYIMDKNGEYIGHFHMQSSPDEMASQIKEIIKK